MTTPSPSPSPRSGNKFSSPISSAHTNQQQLPSFPTVGGGAVGPSTLNPISSGATSFTPSSPSANLFSSSPTSTSLAASKLLSGVGVGNNKQHHQTAHSISHSVSPALTAALVKEYLTAKGLTKTLEAFRLEYLHYQKTPTISSRQELAKQLGIGKLLQQNKAQEQPLKSQLEVIVKSLVVRVVSKESGVENTTPNHSLFKQQHHHSHNQQQQQQPQPQPQDYKDRETPSSVMFQTPLGEFDPSNPRSITMLPGSSPKTGSPKSGPGLSSSPTSAGYTPGYGHHDGGNSNMNSNSTALGAATSSSRQNPGVGIAKYHGLIVKDMKESIASKTGGNRRDSGGDGNSSFMTPSRITPGSASASGSRRPGTASTMDSSAKKQSEDIEVFDDFDDDDDDDDAVAMKAGMNVAAGVNARGGVLASIAKGSLITTQKALGLRRTVFAGSGFGNDDSRGKPSFPDEWRGKGFVFHHMHQDIAYGLIQVKGGPCGLLACVQAYILKYLLFTDSSPELRSNKLRPTSAQCHQALIDAMTEMLWQAGGTRHRRAVVA
ncbi:hypothetical protein HDU76_001147, partial [Blyttiomyces sp. JEL0837]